MVDDLMSSLDPQQTEDGYVFWIRESHPGVIGIVASRLVERLGRPVIVLTDDPKEVGVLTGSGRSIPGFHLLEALGSMAEIFISFGGHSQAAGLRLTHSEFDEFRSRFADYASQRRKDLCRNRICAVDAEVHFSDLTLDFVREIERLQPFGCGNPVPVLLARGIRLSRPIRTLTPGKHFTIPLLQGSCTLDCKAWNFSDHIPLIQSGTPVDVLLNLNEDAYSARRGGPPWSVTLRDVRPSSSEYK